MTVSYLTENDCYKQNKKMKPAGIMVHSTATPGVMNAQWLKAWNKSGIEKAVHAFIDDTGIVQTLPWDTVGWHSGVGSKGKSANANNTGYIGFEICEPAGHTYSGGAMVGYDALKHEEFFDKVYAYAVELCAYLCREYSIPTEKIICHSEGNKMGIASDHSDVMQWFPKHGKSMDIFRRDVQKAIAGEQTGGEQAVRSFKLLEEMNFRQTPNGAKIGAIPEGYVISGMTLEENNGIYWLYTDYNGQKGYVAVLPESKNYAVEIEKTEISECAAELAFYKAAYDNATDKLERIKAIVNET